MYRSVKFLKFFITLLNWNPVNVNLVVSVGGAEFRVRVVALVGGRVLVVQVKSGVVAVLVVHVESGGVAVLVVQVIAVVGGVVLVVRVVAVVVVVRFGNWMNLCWMTWFSPMHSRPSSKLSRFRVQY